MKKRRLAAIFASTLLIAAVALTGCGGNKDAQQDQQANADGIKFIREAGADSAVLQLKSLEAFAKAADGKATKIIIPSDIQGIAGLTAGIKAIAENKD